MHKIKPPFLTVAFSSPGGNVVLAFDSHILLRALKGPTVITHALTRVSSGATDLFLAAEPEYRFASPIASFLLHTARIEEVTNVTPKMLKNMRKNLQVDNRKFESIVTRNTKMTQHEIRKILNNEKDYIFNCEEAVRNGFLQDESHIKDYVRPENAYLISLYNPEDGEKK